MKNKYSYKAMNCINKLMLFVMRPIYSWWLTGREAVGGQLVAHAVNLKSTTRVGSAYVVEDSSPYSYGLLLAGTTACPPYQTDTKIAAVGCNKRRALHRKKPCGAMPVGYCALSGPPSLKTFHRCLVTTERSRPNSAAICSCVSHTVSASRRTLTCVCPLLVS